MDDVVGGGPWDDFTLAIGSWRRILAMMTPIERTITVRFAHRVFFTRQVFAAANPLLRDVLVPASNRRARALLVVDESLHRAQPHLTPQIIDYFTTHAERLELVCAPIVLEGGERVKSSYFHVSEIQSHLDRYHIDRHSCVLAVGGGALLDLVGLAAATAHRGVRHVRLPSTTLSQADSGVGVKNGINAFGKKNFIGTFAVPFAVINDFAFLESLAPRDKRAGYIEAVKVALIRDAAFFEAIEQQATRLAEFDSPSMERLIRRCAELHVQHIATSGDPFEMGSARPLDFGHWAAHKLEQMSEFKLSHGEAVAIGIALDTLYSKQRGYLPERDAQRILGLIGRLGFDLYSHLLEHTDASGALLVLQGLEEFREHLGGDLTITLLRGIGDGFEVHEIEERVVAQCIHELARRHAQHRDDSLLRLAQS